MASLFTNFPYTSDNVPNISIRIDFINTIKQNSVLFEYVNVKSNQTPEQVAYEQYGDAQLYWIILMINNIDDVYTGWCMTDGQLYNYVVDKYGADKVYNIHHYEDSNGKWTSTATVNAVSNYSYEESLNEDKRKIKILKKYYLSQVLSELKSRLRSTS